MIENLTAYTGDIPDKATMTKEAFAEAVYGVHQFYDKTFVAQMQSVIASLNTDISVINTQITFDNYKGEWLGTTAYGLGESVSFAGYWYLSKSANNVGNTPPDIEDVYWKKSAVVYTSGGGVGSQTLKASANIGAGSPVSVLADGTVVNASERVGSLSLGTENTFDNGTIQVIASCYDSTNNVLVVFYYDDVAGASYGVVGTPSGDTVTWGTPVLFLAGRAGGIHCVFDSVSSTCIVAFTDALNASYASAVVGTVSGTSISFGTIAVITTLSGKYIRGISHDAIQNKILVLGDPNVYVGTVSGTSISFGAGVPTSQTGYNQNRLIDAGNSKTVIVGATLTELTCYVATLSGTSLTLGTHYTIATVTTQSLLMAAYDSTGNTLLLLYRDSVTASSYMLAGSIQGTSISWGTPVAIEDVYRINSMQYSPSDGVFYVAIQEGVTQYGKLLAVSVTGDVPTVEYTLTFLNATGLMPMSMAYDATLAKPFLSYASAITISNGKTVAINGSKAFIENFIGVSIDDCLAGNNAVITIAGGVNLVQSGLIPGARYYVDINGDLSTNNDTGIYAGIAIDATKLIVKG